MSDNIREANTDDHGLWSVHRQDDNGNRFIVRVGMSHDDAAQLAAELEARGHKQLLLDRTRDNGIVAASKLTSGG